MQGNVSRTRVLMTVTSAERFLCMTQTMV